MQLNTLCAAISLSTLGFAPHAGARVPMNGTMEPMAVAADDGQRASDTPALTASDDEQSEDDFIIIEDDEDELIIMDDDEDLILMGDDEDEILIYEDDDPEPDSDSSKTSGPLGRLWEALYIGLNSRLTATGQLVELDAGPARLLGDVAFESWLLPARNLSFFANGFARLSLDATPQEPIWNPNVDLYELYAKINTEVGSVLFGRLVIPWGRTPVAALGDRLNHPDHRRASFVFPEPASLKQPQWGVHLRTSLGAVALEGVFFALYESTEGSLAASNQGGARLGRYQTALLQNTQSAEGLLSSENRSIYTQKADFTDATLFAMRASRRLGAFDLGASGVWGVDANPTLHFSPEVGRFLARQALDQPNGTAPVELSQENPCAGGTDCVGPAVLSHARTGSLSADLSWGLGLIILKAEMVAYPKIGLLPGKTAVLISERGMRSTQLSQFSGALAVEGGIGEWIIGTLEVFDVFWHDVPAGAYLYGVESFFAETSSVRQVHRLALGADLSGSLFNQLLDWRVRGESGVLQGDALVSAEIRYNLPIFNLYLGGRGDAFAGFAGSPGWMRQDASAVSIFIGEGR